MTKLIINHSLIKYLLSFINYLLSIRNYYLLNINYYLWIIVYQVFINNYWLLDGFPGVFGSCVFQLFHIWALRNIEVSKKNITPTRFGMFSWILQSMLVSPNFKMIGPGLGSSGRVQKSGNPENGGCVVFLTWIFKISY